MKCKRCDGDKYLQHFSHVQGGVCFRCNGRGVEPGGSPRTSPLPTYAQFYVGSEKGNMYIVGTIQGKRWRHQHAFPKGKENLDRAKGLIKKMEGASLTGEHFSSSPHWKAV